MTNPQPLPDDQVRDAALAQLTHWVAAIADRVNNPIASTLATLSVIERSAEGPVVREAVDRIRGRLTTLAEYVQELMNFGRPDTFSPATIQLSTAIATVALDCEAHGAMVGALDLDLKAATVFADYARLKVALRHLMSNGWEAAARANEPRISVSSAYGDSFVSITVEDNGPGFSRAAEARAGEPFFSTKEAGTGLGLAIVKKFVAAHRGRLQVGRSSALGGAKVTLELPVRRFEVKS